MEELMIKIENVSKMYKLGEIGGTTLRDELQRWSAKRHGREDPTKKIGAKDYNKGETFMALDGVSFEVKKGERVGIIGHNGAGKSTLLKLISRVTAPSGGWIGLNGRVASMLEVGTGFHGELTGRENIYMNGAILGMTKKEIDAKMEDIIEFSECRQFIDTPVKRYSSGMYVKLAFSVAAHLDSEIMIMDEVLAVGDMAFQKKCLDKMSDVSKSEGRTILYVSHNMNTIRQLCDRVIVLDHGKVVFDGGVEEGIGVYMGSNNVFESFIQYDKNHIRLQIPDAPIKLEALRMSDERKQTYQCRELIKIILFYHVKKPIDGIWFRFEISSMNGQRVGTAFSNKSINLKDLNTKVEVTFDTSHLAPGKYQMDIIAFQKNKFGDQILIDAVYPGFFVEMTGEDDGIVWLNQYWGCVYFNDFDIVIS